MADLKEKLLTDRAMRDASKRLVSADWRMFRKDLSAESVASRIGNRLSIGARALAEEAEDFAADNRGAVSLGVAGVLGAVGLWLFSDRLFDDADEEPEPSGRRSDRA